MPQAESNIPHFALAALRIDCRIEKYAQSWYTIYVYCTKCSLFTLPLSFRDSRPHAHAFTDDRSSGEKRMLRKIVVLGYAMLLVFLLCGASAEETLIVGVPELGTDGSMMTDEARERYFSTQLLELSKYTNWQYTLAFDTTDRLLERLEAGEIDMVLGVCAGDASGTRCILPQYAGGYRYARLVTEWDNTDIQEYNLHTIRNLRIATVEDPLIAEKLASFLTMNSLQAEIVYADSMDASVALVTAGAADVALVDEAHGESLRDILRFALEPCYYAFAPGREDLAAAYDEAFASILQVYPDYISDLQSRTEKEERTLMLTEDEKKAIASVGTLRVAIRANNPPTEYYDADGQPGGISYEVIKRVAADLGLAVEAVRADTLLDAYRMVEAGEADALFGVEVRGNLEQTRRFAMTHSLLDVHSIVLINRYLDVAQGDLTIALIPGMEFQLNGFEGNTVYANSFAECAALVNRGEADFTYGSPYQVEALLQQRTLRNIHALTIPDSQNGIALGLRRPANAALLTSLNKAIGLLTVETVRDITLEQTMMQQEGFLIRFLYAYPVPVAVALFIIITVITVGSIHFHRMQRRHSNALYRTQYIDTLTGALNMNGLRREEARILKNPKKCAVSYVAIRNFQYLNDRYGYEEGDRILKQMADLYRKTLRPDEAFCRVSGRSFIAIRFYEDEEKLRDRLDQFHQAAFAITPRTDPDYHLRLTAGVYLSDSPDQRHNLFSMLDRANAAQKEILRLSEVKYDVYREGLLDRQLNSQGIESRMEAALNEGAFKLYLQPKIDLKRMVPVGAEALVRWHEGDYVVPPSEFIDLFERNGFIARLDRYMLEQCCRAIRQWLDDGMPAVPVSVNVSRILLYQPGFVDDYLSVKNAYAIPDGMIELEFTESIFSEDMSFLNDIIQSFRKNGFQCSIDDFGKGYSSLTMLKNVQVDVIKLDAQFFSKGVSDMRDVVVVESVLDLAKTLGMGIVAEGIERMEQMRFLQMIGCEIAQGYLFSRPVDRPRFERYLRAVLREGKSPYAAAHGDTDA